MIHKEFNLANLITLARMIGVGFILWAMPFQTILGQVAIIIIYILIALTDFFDGWVARRYNLVSDTGKILDPLADKLLVLIFLPLLALKVISPFPVFIILAREFAVMGLRVFIAKKGRVASSGFSGKLKTALTLPLIGLLLARVPSLSVDLPLIFKPFAFLISLIQSLPIYIFEIYTLLVVIITIFSFVTYCLDFFSPPDSQKKFKNYKRFLVLIPNFITLLNFSCGLLSIFNSITHAFEIAAAFILLGCIFDAFDGLAARLLNAKSRFGAQLDTSTDFISFGVAPAVFSYIFLSSKLSMPLAAVAGILSFIYTCAVYFRLKRYADSGHAKFFKGLPAPGMAAALVYIFILPLPVPIAFIFIGMLAITLLGASTLAYPHNSISRYFFLFPLFKNISFIFWMLQIITLFGLSFPYAAYLACLNLTLMLPYICSPIWPNSYKNHD